jgi:eukaryotic-like serine/threonine-protein kinase
MAARYCNWLSKEEGIPQEAWCYEINAKEFKLKPNYLSRSGYRLPTEAETEFATRAGASTARYYGESEELLPPMWDISGVVVRTTDGWRFVEVWNLSP